MHTVCYNCILCTVHFSFIAAQMLAFKFALFVFVTSKGMIQVTNVFLYIQTIPASFMYVSVCSARGEQWGVLDVNRVDISAAKTGNAVFNLCWQSKNTFFFVFSWEYTQSLKGYFSQDLCLHCPDCG